MTQTAKQFTKEDMDKMREQSKIWEARQEGKRKDLDFFFFDREGELLRIEQHHNVDDLETQNFHNPSRYDSAMLSVPGFIADDLKHTATDQVTIEAEINRVRRWYYR